MTSDDPDEATGQEVLRALSKLDIAKRRLAATAGEKDRERLIHDLHVHQVELEMQNHELREAQRRLEEATSRYSDLYDFAPVGYCTLDPSGRLLELNTAAAALLGAPKAKLVGNAFSSVAQLESRQLFLTHMSRCTREAGQVVSELTLRPGARGPRSVRMISEPVRDRAGETSYRTILVDISDLKAMEGTLRLLAAAGETLTSTLEPAATIEAAVRLAVPDLADVCMLDLASESGAVERKAAHFADPEHQAALAALTQAPRPGWQAPQGRVIASGEPMLLPEMPVEPRQPGSNVDRDAEVRAADLRSLMIVPLTARGRTFGALTLASVRPGRRYAQLDLEVAQDLARRVAMALDNARLYAEAQRAIQARDNVLGVVAHDLRNPLATILMNTGLHGSDREPKDRCQQTSRVIERAVHRMDRLVQDLLDITGLEAGTLSLEKTPVDPGKAISEVMAAEEELAASKSLELRLDLAPDLRAVDADRDRLAQVLENLVGNAMKFTGPGGRITVGASPGDGEVLFRVADTGAGIEPQELSHLFDRFWKARRVHKEGIGLGLTIVKGIVEAHGGRVWVESQVGVGSTFFFTMPSAAPEAEAAGPSGAAREEPPVSPRSLQANGAPSGSRVVLVVEDDADVRSALVETLERAGYRAVTATDGADALAYLHREGPPSFVILDLSMPVMDGWAFLDERNRDPDLRSIPVIVVSGERGVEGRVAAARASYIQKPVASERLIEAMEHIAR